MRLKPSALIMSLLMVSSVLAVLTSITAQPVMADDWWNTDWAYRRQITVSYHPDDYQIRVDIPSDIPKSEYPSIRFLEDEDSGGLDFWLELVEPNAYTGVAWVRRPTYADDTIYMYYGNPDASDASDGDATFMFFDDFGGYTLDESKWRVVKEGRWWRGLDVYEYVLRIEAGNWWDLPDRVNLEHGGAEIPIPLSELTAERIIEFRVKPTSWWRRGGLGLSGPDGFGDPKEYVCFFEKGGGEYRFFSDGWWSGTNNTADRWYIGRLDMYGTDKLRARFYWAELDADYRKLLDTADERTNDWMPPGRSCDKYKLMVWKDGHPASSYYYDWFFVRRYADPEPSVTVGGEEEQAIPVTATVDIDPDTLNLKSKGKWITAYIEATRGGVAVTSDIELCSVTLVTPVMETVELPGEGEVEVPITVYHEDDEKYSFVYDPQIIDRDGNGVEELMVKFDRQELQAALADLRGDVELKVTGTVNGQDFEASDTIRVIRPGK